MTRSWLGRPWFFPAAVATFAVGNALDLMGTFAYQPNFEHEANPLYVFLRPYGLRLNWPMVILGKALTCVVAAWGLKRFLDTRLAHYPEPGRSFRELITRYLYGRPLGWVESCFKMPRSFAPSVLSMLAFWCLGGPYYAYLGYGNLAAKYGWWRLGGRWFGRYWVDWALPTWLTVSIVLLGALIWDDYRKSPGPAASEAAG